MFYHEINGRDIEKYHGFFVCVLKVMAREK